MCHQFNISRLFGYRHAEAIFSDNTSAITFCQPNLFYQNSSTDNIKIIVDQSGPTFLINGLQLLLSQYISQSIKMPVSFVKQVHLGKVSILANFAQMQKFTKN